MEKDLNITVLLDVYGQLLTEKQRFAIDMYYNEDLSLSEIAEQIDISRQGVRESIKQGEKHLEEYEKHLGIVKRFHKINSQLRRLSRIADGCEAEFADEIKEIIEEISREI